MPRASTNICLFFFLCNNNDNKIPQKSKHLLLVWRPTSLVSSHVSINIWERKKKHDDSFVRFHNRYIFISSFFFCFVLHCCYSYQRSSSDDEGVPGCTGTLDGSTDYCYDFVEAACPGYNGLGLCPMGSSPPDGLFPLKDCQGDVSTHTVHNQWRFCCLYSILFPTCLDADDPTSHVSWFLLFCAFSPPYPFASVMMMTM